MPDIGFLELLVIGVIALLILGPERTPEFFAQIARLIRQGRTWMSSIKQQIDLETQALKEPVQSARDAIDEGISSISDEIKTHTNIHDADSK